VLGMGKSITNMGTKEDGLPTRLVLGYHGEIRPMQTDGGKCKKCHKPVFIDPPVSDEKRYLNTEVLHYGCY